MSARPVFKAQEASCWQLKQLGLAGKPHTAGDYKTTPSLKISVSDGGNTKLQIYANDIPGDTRSINIGFKPEDLFLLFQTIRLVANNPEPSKYMLTVSDQFRNGQRLETPVKAAMIYIGRGQDKLIYIGIQQSPQRQMCIFQYRLGYLVELLDESGEKIDIGVESTLKAKGWCNMFEKLVATFIAHVKPVPTTPTGQTSTPAYRPPQQQAPAHANNSAFDEEIPF